MKMKNVTCAGVIGVGLMAAVVYGWSYNPEVFTISSEGGGMGTQLSGDYVVWQDNMGMQWHGYDLASQESFTIAGGGAMSMLSNAYYAVWQDSMAMRWYGYNLAERRKFALSVSDLDGMSVRLAGRFLIFKGMMDMTLRGTDLASGEVFDMASGDIDGMSVRAAGDYVVWKTMALPAVLMGYQLSARESFVVSSEEIDFMGIAMSAQFITWRRMGGAEPAQGGVYGFDLTTRETFLVTLDDIDAMSLKAAGRYIFGRDMMSGVLYGFDAVSRELFTIGEDVDSMTLRVNEHYAAWKGTADMHLYGFALDDRRLIETGEDSTYSATLAGSYLFLDYYDGVLMANELRGFDLATRTGFSVASTDSAGVMTLLAEGNYVVWSDTFEPGANTGLLGARIWKVPNDACEDAVEVVAETAYMGDTSGALGTDVTDCGFGDRLDTWHAFRPPAGGEYTLDAGSDAFDTTLAVFAGCSGDAVVCNDDASVETTDSRLVMTLVKGKRYLLRVAGVDGSVGPYALTISRGSCIAPPQADLTGDCRVNVADLAIFASQWLGCGLHPAELCM